ncbi:MAG: HK97 family phage prohead protease [Gemmobacter sp.]
MDMDDGMGLERKFHRPAAGLALRDGAVIEGYASVFGLPDQGGDVVAAGAFAASVKAGGRVAMLWQHDPREPIGVWEAVDEDAHGLRVRGRLLPEVGRAREAAALIAAGAIDGLSIGYRVKRAARDGEGRRVLTEVELWEVSLVTFPMLRAARVAAKAAPGPDVWAVLAAGFAEARRGLAG